MDVYPIWRESRNGGLKRDVYGITELYDNSDAFIQKGMDANVVSILRESVCGYCLYESEPKMEELTWEVFEQNLVDELYLYISSYTGGSGIPIFSHNIKMSNHLKLVEAKVYNEEIVRLHYSRVDITEKWLFDFLSPQINICGCLWFTDSYNHDNE